jgi:hypothetical protein
MLDNKKIFTSLTKQEKSFSKIVDKSDIAEATGK